MDYRMLFAVCVLSIHLQIVSSKRFTFEVEKFVTATKRVPRSSASGNFSVHLQNEDLVQVEFCLRKKSLVTILNVVYSNDGDSDTIDVTIDDQHAGTFRSDALKGEGEGWNVFKASTPLKSKVLLQTGRHVVNIRVTHSDEWGIEIDNFLLDIDDNLMSEDDIVCNLYCFDIAYDDVPKRDTIPSGRFLQKSTNTQCSEQDNIKVEVYHDTAKSFHITANLPKYVSFSNKRDPDYINCKLASPFWIFTDQEVSQTAPEVQSHGATMHSSGTNYRTTKIVTFSFRSLTPTRELDERLIESNLYLKLRNMPRENVRVIVEYMKNRRWVKLPEKEFTPFDNEENWSIPERAWSISEDNKIRVIIERGKQGVVIETLKLQRVHKPDYPVELYSDDDIVLQGVKLGAWHHRYDRPNSMTAFVQSGNGMTASFLQIDSIRVYSRVPWTGGYAQVFVLFQDGRTRLQAITPHGLDYIPFGSSVHIGQPASTNQERPYAPIETVKIDPKALQMVVTYLDGNTAVFKLDLTYRKTKLIVNNINFVKNRALFPIMTFQSMWVQDGNADVDHVTINGDTSRHIMSEWNQLFGISAVFFKKCITEHNTQGPDITITFT